MYFNRSVHYKQFILGIHPMCIYIYRCIYIYYYYHYYYHYNYQYYYYSTYYCYILYIYVIWYIYTYIYIYVCVCVDITFTVPFFTRSVSVWLSSISSISSGDKKAQLAAQLVAKLDANDAGTSEFLARRSGSHTVDFWRCCSICPV